jgi:trehalose 6-phosphate phosphatase
MIDLSSPEGRDLLQRFTTPATLFAFDLDGTLAPIVHDPAAAILPEAIQQCMRQLSCLAVTAIITGRSCSDARQRLGFEPRYLVGNHGLEGLPDSTINLQELDRLITSWHRQLQAVLDPPLLQELYQEQKVGSLSLHYRHADDPETAHTALLTAIKKLEPPPRRVGGKYVENLIPHGVPHKGDALLQLMSHAGSERALFVGDDETDEDVFRLDDPRILSVCVGTDRPSAARCRIDDQLDMKAALQEIIRILHQTE